jgi:hypothetical protein
MNNRSRCAQFLIAALFAVSCDVQKTAAPHPNLAFDRSDEGGKSACPKHGRNPNTPVAFLCVISVPGNPITSSDIAWVDPGTERYYIADRSNFGVDIVDAERLVYVGRVAGMTGVLPSGGGTATTNGPGPNGVVVTPEGQAWVGDGNSTVRVADVDPDSPSYLKIVSSVSTAAAACDNGTVHYCGRADEIGYDPDERLILIANPSPLSDTGAHASVDPYATFISARRPYRVLSQIAFAGAGGLEQPVWDGGLHRFLLSVPGKVVSGAVTKPASLVVINPETRLVEKTYTLNCAALNGATSASITGVALGEFQHVLVSACGNPIILDGRTGSVVNVITQVGGGDEVWYNRGDERFYVTGPNTALPAVQSLGVIDADRATWLENVADVRGKNAAAFAENNLIFTVVQITAAIAAAPATDNSICASVGVAGTGCIAVFDHTAPAASEE